MINLTVLFEVIMFGRRYVSVELGDIFVEDLPGKKSIFRAMGVAETTPSERFLSYWKVEELVGWPPRALWCVLFCNSR